MKKIAIVDDEINILKILNSFLSRKFEVTTFENPIVALQHIQSETYDLVLCDIMMPDMTGLELLKNLRENNNDTKVVIMTAFDSMDKALEAHTYGAVNYLKKPFNDLKSVENQILDELS